MERGFVGIDLAWSTGVTGLAVVDDEGRLRASGRLRTDEDIDAWLGAHAQDPRVVAIDAPLVVPNETGMRLPERLIGSAFGAFGASCHTSNQRMLGHEPSRALRLARRSGWSVDPDDASGATQCIEVYPHPAMVGLFGLDYRLAYKLGRVGDRAAGFALLVGLLETVEALQLATSARWEELRSMALDPRPGDLDRIEDELDAILCAHLAWLWHHDRSSLQVYGSLADGYIVAPAPPTHRAVRPLRAGAQARAQDSGVMLRK